MKVTFLGLALLITVAAWGQPAPSPTSVPGSVRHASETDKAAIFGYMINARSGELKGNPLKSVYAQCMLPALLCGILTPLYFRLARRGQAMVTTR